MLDVRHNTFLALCKIGNYTKTADYLHITQPAVSQHIKYLESLYGGKLFYYENKVLQLTWRGQQLRRFAMQMGADWSHLQFKLVHQDTEQRTLHMGATLSIGEFVLPSLLGKLLKTSPQLQVNVSVENTQELLEKLDQGELDIILVEGHFDKSKYDHQLFALENFIAVSSSRHPKAAESLSLEEVVEERIIIRESGSGTRDIFEQILKDYNFGISSFSKVCEYGNINGIKALVASNLGITFLYEATVKKELREGSLVQLSLQGFPLKREFSFVWLKNSLHQEEYRSWANQISELADSTKREV